jgi:hypothetical protein
MISDSKSINIPKKNLFKNLANLTTKEKIIRLWNLSNFLKKHKSPENPNPVINISGYHPKFKTLEFDLEAKIIFAINLNDRRIELSYADCSILELLEFNDLTLVGNKIVCSEPQEKEV